jgi:hypothetical protein
VNEINFYEKFKDNEDIKPFISDYYGCVTSDDNIYMIIQYFRYGFQKYQGDPKNKTNMTGYSKFQRLKGSEQIEFLTKIARVVGHLHKQYIALTNINVKNIVLKETENGFTPVLISFGHHQYFDKEQWPVEQDDKELKRYDHYLFYYLQDQPDEDFIFSLDNRPKSDILAFANLIYRSGPEINTFKPNPNSKTNTSEIILKFLNDDLLSARKYIRDNAENKDNFTSLMIKMIWIFEKRNNNFTTIIRDMEKIKCANEIEENNEEEIHQGREREGEKIENEISFCEEDPDNESSDIGQAKKDKKCRKKEKIQRKFEEKEIRDAKKIEKHNDSRCIEEKKGTTSILNFEMSGKYGSDKELGINKKYNDDGMKFNYHYDGYNDDYTLNEVFESKSMKKKIKEESEKCGDSDRPMHSEKKENVEEKSTKDESKEIHDKNGNFQSLFSKADRNEFDEFFNFRI